MNLKDQCTSLEQAKKLKELKVAQKSTWQWVLNKPEHPRAGWSIFANSLLTSNFTWEDKCCAFTSDELFELLPAWIDIKTNEPFNNFYLQIKKRTAENIKYIATYVCDSMPGEEASNPLYQLQSSFTTHSPKLADCLAEMLILIKEQGL